MPITKDELQQSVLELPVEERWELAESILESLEPEATLPLHDWQRSILDQRIADEDGATEAGAPWPEVKKRILAAL